MPLESSFIAIFLFQIAPRMRLSRSLFSATKKFFSQAVGGSSAGSVPAPPQISTLSSSPLPSSSSLSSPTSLSLIQQKPAASQSGLVTQAPISLVPQGNISGQLGLSSTVNGTSGMTISNLACSTSSWQTGNPPVETSSGDQISGLSSLGTSIPVASTASSTNAALTIVYAPEAVELQMRRLADLAFLFQQYESAHQAYNVLKRDFQNDSSWLHYAGAMVNLLFYALMCHGPIL
ncbi:unnamed protein product [Protopolystoma xenopodis]|uniref:Uncharacterized protein n=1 Tax=Protopolystoma xenopodis TaxID=117903 RepID=A0A3S5CNY1_9PLAT|nr:unnamed protein product [Protopolystoma xenopodis]